MMTKFWKDALMRALRTFCQSLVTLIGTTAVSIADLDWPQMLGISATTALVSLLTSIATGLPETDAAYDSYGLDDFEDGYYDENAEEIEEDEAEEGESDESDH